ncbi:MAG: hypothetical protein RQ833_07575 [Sphingomonadaceae bacterium]|nr:hypothetical protein [Sphingomonadaceae bacterium]
MRKHFTSIGLIAVAMAAALAFYMVNLKVSAEREHVERLRADIARDTADIYALQTELHARAPMPELQRWNDVSLRLEAPRAQQLLGSPVQLAALHLPPAAGAASGSAAPAAAAATADPIPSTKPTVAVITTAPGQLPLQRAAGRTTMLAAAQLNSLAAQARAESAAAAAEALAR